MYQAMSSTKSKKNYPVNSQPQNIVMDDSYDDSITASRINKSLAAIVRDIQAIQNESVMSEFSVRNVSHIYKAEETINMLLLKEQNLPCSESCTDVLFRCSNGHVRCHSLLMMSSTLILETLKENQDNANLNDEGSRSIALNGYKVEHIAKILFLFYTGTVIFTIENEKKITLRLLEILGVNYSSIVVEVPLLLNSIEYKKSMHDKMKGLQLRISLTRLRRNNERAEDEYFIRPDGSMEPLNKEWNMSEILVLDTGTGFYCEICKSSYAGHGTLQNHMALKHDGMQNGRSRNQERHSLAQGPSDMRVSTTTTEQPYYLDQPCTSAAARNQLASTQLRQPNVVGAIEKRINQPAKTPEQDDVVEIIIHPPTVTSTPNVQGSTSRRFRQPLRRQNGNLNFLACGICSLVVSSDTDMKMHLNHNHSRLNDESGKYLGNPCLAKDFDLFKGTSCLVCNLKYLSPIALKEHYKKVHEIIDLDHYTLSPIPKCHVCKTKLGIDHADGIDATHFFDHVRRCRIKTIPSELPNDLKKGKQQQTSAKGKGKNSVQPTKLVKWSSVANMKMTVAEVQQQPAAKRKISAKPIPERSPFLGHVAAQQKKKKKLDTVAQGAERAASFTKISPVRVLRSGRHFIGEKTKASKIPKKQTQTRAEQLPTAAVDQEPGPGLGVSNVNSQKGRPTAKKSPQVGQGPATKKIVRTDSQKNKGPRLGRPRNENEVAAAVQPVQKDVPLNEESDDSIVYVPVNEKNKVLKKSDKNVAKETPNADENNDEDKENIESGEELRGRKSIANHLSSASLSLSTPRYHSTCISDAGELGRAATAAASKVATLRLRKVAEAASATAEWVCNNTQETIAADLSNLEPETQRSSTTDMTHDTYMTAEQTLERFSVRGSIGLADNSEGDFDNFQGFSDSLAAKISQAALEYAQIIQNQSVSISLSNVIDDSEQYDTHQNTCLLGFPVDIASVFME